MEAVIRLEEAVRQVNLTSGQPARQRAFPRLQAHPEHLDTPSRQLREVIGVSHTTVHKAQQILKDAGEES